MSLIQVKAEHTAPRASRLSQSLLSVQAPSSNSLLSANLALENTLTLFGYEPNVRVARLDCVDIIFKRCSSFSSPNSSCRASTLVSSDPRLLWSLHGFVSSPFPLHWGPTRLLPAACVFLRMLACKYSRTTACSKFFSSFRFDHHSTCAKLQYSHAL